MLLTTLNNDSRKYNTHSFRNGVTTTTREANVPDALTQPMGRCKSNTYITYGKTPPVEMARLSKYEMRDY